MVELDDWPYVLAFFGCLGMAAVGLVIVARELAAMVQGDTVDNG